MAQHMAYKDNSVKEISKLKAQLKAKDEQIRLCMDALNQMKLMKSSHSNNGAGADKIVKELNKAKDFDVWLEKHKDELVEKEYEKCYKSDVDEFSRKLEQMYMLNTNKRNNV